MSKKFCKFEAVLKYKIQATLRITNDFGPGVLFAIESIRYIEC